MPRITSTRYITNAVSRLIIKSAFEEFCKDNNIPVTGRNYLNKHIEAFGICSVKALKEELSAEDREPWTHENQTFINELAGERSDLVDRRKGEKEYDDFIDKLAQEADDYTAEQKEGILKTVKVILDKKLGAKVIPLKKEKSDVDTSNDSP